MIPQRTQINICKHSQNEVFMKGFKYVKEVIYAAGYVFMFLMVEGFGYYAAAIIPHEAAHFISARVLGYKTTSFRVTPFGLNIIFKEEFIKPLDDIVISLSGPLINFIFFVALAIAPIENNILSGLKKANLILLIFNMIPAGFLDGGRILQTLLKAFGSFNIAHVTICLNGYIIGCIIILGTFALKDPAQRAFVICIGFILVIKSVVDAKKIILKVIADTLYKCEHYIETQYCNIIIRVYSGNTKLIDIIKHFCFNKYYIILIKENFNLSVNISETEIIRKYCSLGNITIYEAVKAAQEESK